jgi:hypothetical protein
MRAIATATRAIQKTLVADSRLVAGISAPAFGTIKPVQDQCP